MTKSLYLSILRKVLLFGTIFMFGECVYHFSNVRLQGTELYWPVEAVVFSRFFMWLWASASLLLAFILWYCYKNLSQVPGLIIILGIFSFFHAGLLWSFSLLPLTTIWANTPAAFVWSPWYTTQLKVEATLLVAFGLWIVYGVYRTFLKTKN